MLVGFLAGGVVVAEMVRVERELGRIARHEMALAGALSRVAASHLKQSVQFERALRHAAESAPDVSSNYREAKVVFESFAASMWRELRSARGILSDSPRAPQAPAALSAELAAIDYAHNEYASLVREVFVEVESGRLPAARALAEGLGTTESRFEESLGELLVRVSTLASEASVEVESSQRRTVGIGAGLMVLATVLAALAVARTSMLVSEMKSLSGLLPICASCKKIRDDDGYWNQLEAYVEANSEAAFTHGLCGDCQHQMKEEVRRSRQVESPAHSSA